MPIQLAFSTVACPQWKLDEVLQQAKTMGYQGVELRTLAPPGSAPAHGSAPASAGDPALASDPATLDPAAVRAQFQAAGIEPVCLSTSLALHYRGAAAGRAAQAQLGQYLDLAAQIGCRAVRIFGNAVEPGENVRSAITLIAERARPLADRAGALGVQLLFENAGSFAKAREWWWLLEVLDHPMVGLCWNVANAAAAQETPAVSVPMLNSRIRLAKVKDSQLATVPGSAGDSKGAGGSGGGGGGGVLVPLGDGQVGVPQFVRRLLGIGYAGYITVEWDRLWLPALAPAAEVLPDARQRLRTWLDQAAAALAAGPGDASPPPPPGAEKKRVARPAPAAKAAPAAAAKPA